ncbi:MAG: RNA-directed DNA polymerase [Ignavibacteria bacterium]|nr:RNA-directed DNA polymerase [Ignavibacteria bacterium]
MEGYEKEFGGRVVVMGWDEQEPVALTMLRETTGMSYCVEADVSACFASIYSHSIPWALVGHEVAKQNRDDQWYNLIDKCQRSMKRGETQGVPSGPATSNIVVRSYSIRSIKHLETLDTPSVDI